MQGSEKKGIKKKALKQAALRVMWRSMEKWQYRINRNAIIVLNGPTRSGKTTFAKWIKAVIGSLPGIEVTIICRDDYVGGGFFHRVVAHHKKNSYGYEARRKVLRRDSFENHKKLTEQPDRYIDLKDHTKIRGYEADGFAKIFNEEVIEKPIKEMKLAYNRGHVVIVDSNFLLACREYKVLMKELARLIKEEDYKAFFVKVHCSIKEGQRRAFSEYEEGADGDEDQEYRPISMILQHWHEAHAVPVASWRLRKRFDWTVNTQRGINWEWRVIDLFHGGFNEWDSYREGLFYKEPLHICTNARRVWDEEERELEEMKRKLMSKTIEKPDWRKKEMVFSADNPVGAIRR